MSTEQTDNRTPEPISFRGRNGWANLAHSSVSKYGDTVCVSLYSRRYGSMPPVVIQGDQQKMRGLLQELIDKIDTAEDAITRAAELQRRDVEEAEALR
jgi:hypothetical protein